MDRLTPKHGWENASYDSWEICGLDSVCNRDCHEPKPCQIPKMLRRLAAYENTGMSPEEIDGLKFDASQYEEAVSEIRRMNNEKDALKIYLNRLKEIFVLLQSGKCAAALLKTTQLLTDIQTD